MCTCVCVCACVCMCVYVCVCVCACVYVWRSCVALYARCSCVDPHGEDRDDLNDVVLDSIQAVL